MRSGTLDRDTADKLLSSSLPGVHQPIYGKQFFIFCEVFQCHSLFAGLSQGLVLVLAWWAGAGKSEDPRGGTKSRG